MARYKKRPGASRRRERGAALLLLVALMGVGAASLLITAFSRGDREARHNRQTLARLAAASDALVGYATAQGRLPRPAVSATDGRERSEACTSEDSCTGFLPWVTLGVEGADAWGKRLRYSVTPAYTVAPVLRISTVATKTVQTRFGSGALAYLVGQASCELGAQCAPLVVLSQGRENFGSSVLGIVQPNTASGNVDEQLNDQASVHFVSRPATTDATVPGGVFDDLVTFVPLDFLYKQMGAARKLP
jgi:type II secretory pathway pseudopilin PulG